MVAWYGPGTRRQGEILPKVPGKPEAAGRSATVSLGVAIPTMGTHSRGLCGPVLFPRNAISVTQCRQYHKITK